MKIETSARQRALGVLMILGALVYLTHFVPRGWIPHDEGMLGESAELVLRGGIPHIDYEEPYTGGLSWMYAGLFTLTGTDLLHVRWLLFFVACGSTLLIFSILRRFMGGVAAGVATLVAFAWSFPNYFAGLPSWWLLACALMCVWAVIRHMETGLRRFLIAAGLAAGVAIAIKQTGVYLLVALVISLLYSGGPMAFPRFSALLAVRWMAALGSLGLGLAILGSRTLGAEGVYLLVPALACSVVLFAQADDGHDRARVHDAIVATMSAIVPFGLILLPYLSAHKLWNFVNGAVLLPRARLVFASAPMQPVNTILMGVPLIVLLFSHGNKKSRRESTVFAILYWSSCILLPVLALWNFVPYQIIWQSARATAALLPPGVCWLLTTHRVPAPIQKRILFLLVAVLAWMSFNQFPYAGGIYFCYVAPIAVIGACALAPVIPSFGQRMLPYAVLLVLFAVLGSHREYVQTLGAAHRPLTFETPLDLPRAHLMVSQSDAEVYRRLLSLIATHQHGGTLMAGPDCPEVYFLAGATSPSGRLFDFFSEHGTAETEPEANGWEKSAIVVLNHRPEFSPIPSDESTKRLRRDFPNGEEIGKFEIRWR
jgi:hypothetical protein